MKNKKKSKTKKAVKISKSAKKKIKEQTKIKKKKVIRVKKTSVKSKSAVKKPKKISKPRKTASVKKTIKKKSGSGKGKKPKFVKKIVKSSFRSLPVVEYKSESSPTPAKPCKPKSEIKFTAGELKKIKETLKKTKAEITKRIQEKRDLDMPQSEVGDPIDQALQSLDKELLFEVTDTDLAMVDQIEAAIRRIEKGVFAICQSCGCAITKKRLNALPFARYCINCQSTSEFSGSVE